MKTVAIGIPSSCAISVYKLVTSIEASAFNRVKVGGCILVLVQQIEVLVDNCFSICVDLQVTLRSNQS